MRFLLVLALAACALGFPARADVFSFLDSGRAVQTGPRELSVSPGEDGIYYVFAEVNGARIRFVIDTGSDDVVLTAKDARRAGIDVSQLHFTEDYDAETGSGQEADATVRQFSIGPLALANLPVSVNEDGGASLLGMSFLHRMKSVEIRDNRLYLRW
ncbi:MAG TPA: TIGR02281 family clan AA aspartic protease [Rhizomicrobium sp.]|nr:TIGR02281 family clan AA aspartic protease [Rhizomicrobium sp.]